MAEVSSRLGVSSHSLYQWVKAVTPDKTEKQASELIGWVCTFRVLYATGIPCTNGLSRMAAETLFLSGRFNTMLTNRMTLAVRVLACAAILCVATISANAHPFPDVHLGAAQVPTATAPIETVTGTIKELVIDNRVTGQTTRQVALLLDDGRKLALNGKGLDALTQNQRVQANGQLSGDALFLSAYHVVAGDVCLGDRSPIKSKARWRWCTRITSTRGAVRIATSFVAMTDAPHRCNLPRCRIRCK